MYTIVSIEGNIGSGKTTLMEALKEHYKHNDDIVFLKEPVDKWAAIKDKNGTTILEKFYADQEKYSFSFQMMAYVSRIKELRDVVQEKQQRTPLNHFIVISERSLHTDKMVFAKMLFDAGKIEDVNYQIYLNWFDTFSEEFRVNKVIYVETCPAKCHERISKRARNGEEHIPVEYLISCERYHAEMLSDASGACKDQLLLDGNIDIFEKSDVLIHWIELVDRFL